MGNVSTNYVDGIGGFMIDILKAYQAWRRGDDERTLEDIGLTPAMIGEAIDWAIGVAEERDALKAHVELLRNLAEFWVNQAQPLADRKDEYMTWLALGHHSKAMTASPAQCLAEIKAQAGREGFIAALNDYGSGSVPMSYYTKLAEEYSIQIRQQVEQST